MSFKAPNEIIDVNKDLPDNKGELFSAGFSMDVTKKESCFYADHVKEMDNSALKYFWTMGKNGVMITKMNVDSYDELPRNSKGHIMSSVMIRDALNKQNEKFLDRFFKSEYGEQYHEYIRSGQNVRDLEDSLWEGYKTTYINECIKDLDTCLKDEGLFNQVTGKPLYTFNYISNKKEKPKK